MPTLPLDLIFHNLPVSFVHKSLGKSSLQQVQHNAIINKVVWASGALLSICCRVEVHSGCVSIQGSRTAFPILQFAVVIWAKATWTTTNQQERFWWWLWLLQLTCRLKQVPPCSALSLFPCSEL